MLIYARKRLTMTTRMARLMLLLAIYVLWTPNNVNSLPEKALLGAGTML